MRKEKKVLRLGSEKGAVELKLKDGFVGFRNYRK